MEVIFVRDCSDYESTMDNVETLQRLIKNKKYEN